MGLVAMSTCSERTTHFGIKFRFSAISLVKTKELEHIPLKLCRMGVMTPETLHPIPTRDPVSGKQLIVSELSCPESGVTIRGRFAIPRYATLEPDQAAFLQTFLRCRGILSSVERELGISYPTVRARLDALLAALELAPVKEQTSRPVDRKVNPKRQAVLDQLDRGEISAAEAKERIREAAQ